MAIELRILTDNVDDVIRQLEQMGPAARAALTRAVRKATQSAATQAARDIAKRSDVSVRALTQGGRKRGQRIFSRVPPAKGTTRDEMNGSVWVGYNPIGARAVGQFRQDERGAWARRYYFEGSFLATMPSGYRSIFSRAGNTRHKAANNKWGTTELPIEEETVALTVAEPVLRGIERAARARLRDVLISELNYELNVKRR